MAVKTQAQLLAQVASLLADNTTGDISANDVRTCLNDIIDSASYGGKKVYKALLTQSGTNAPVATVLENTLSGTPVWSYSSTGTFKSTLAGEWVNLKTGILTTSTADGFTEAYVNTVDEIEVITFNASGTKTNGLLYQQLIVIEVYP